MKAASMTIAQKRQKRTRRLYAALFGVALIGLVLAVLAWLGFQAKTIRDNLESALNMAASLPGDAAGGDSTLTVNTVDSISSHTTAARQAANDPLWLLSSSIPGLGENFSTVTELATAADDVAQLAAKPLASVYASLDWQALTPGKGEALPSLLAARPQVVSAAHAVRQSGNRLSEIDDQNLFPEVAAPLREARGKLSILRDELDVAESVVTLAPEMLGKNGTRNYLLLIQNNAESRASGGIPGALAVLTVSDGKLTLGAQESAASIGATSPPVQTDPAQVSIYSSRLGKYMQDVNLTPDFPTAASTAQAMWERKTGQRVDGVISIDPVVLSYIIQSTGPVAVSGPELAVVQMAGLPAQLTGNNVVPTLLSNVYSQIQQPKMQDVYFASVAKEVFAAISSGRGDAKGLIAAITRGTNEGRVLLWSARTAEQSILTKYTVSGSISGPSVLPAQFGVYFNDGTGAKMDYYVKRTVQLVKDCPAEGYEQTRVRVTSTNTAPADAGVTLPAYVTGGGLYGVAPGSVQTNVVAYGPALAQIESAMMNGQKIPFAPYLHATRPVGVVAQQLAPGESETVEFTFGKIVQHTEPNVVVTPSVQPVKDVILPTENASCYSGK